MKEPSTVPLYPGVDLSEHETYLFSLSKVDVYRYADDGEDGHPFYVIYVPPVKGSPRRWITWVPGSDAAMEWALRSSTTADEREFLKSYAALIQ